VLIALLVWFICRLKYESAPCNREAEISSILNSINRQLENCCNCEIATPSDSTSSEIDRLRDSLNGKVGELTVTLAWNTKDDLDLYLVEPSGAKIYFKTPFSPSGGRLDIDMNRDDMSLTSSAIENIFYNKTPLSGSYKVYVENYKKNTNVNSIKATLQIKSGSYSKEIPLSIVNNNSRNLKLIHSFVYPLSE
jgi:uncharacterized protein YfaP (DUF2135 family)